MTHDNVIAMKLYTPDQMERKNLMWEGDCLLGDMAPDQMGLNRPFPGGSRLPPRAWRACTCADLPATRVAACTPHPATTRTR